MPAFRIETTIKQDRQLNLNDLPLKAGEEIEVIIPVKRLQATNRERYPLRGMPVTYVDPTEPVAQGDWEVIK